jgi:2-C-methyl-D-erythritol 4-phosphate cytidylyltransferase/2-C-methyl-D-erythritol 2,4-cyclodiphosphate synthase
MASAGPNIALIVSAGSGSRAGSDIPKQFREIGGKALLAYSVDAFAAHPAIDGMVLVIGEGQEAAVRAALGNRSTPPLVTGGATRKDSVRAGLDYLARNGAPRTVLIHDAARPFLSARIIDDLLSKLTAYEGAVPTLPVSDTLVRFDGTMGDTVSREHIYRVQTPQAFVFDAVLAAHRLWPEAQEATDDAQMVRDTGHEVTIVPGDIMLEKITRAEDFERAEALLAQQPRISRTGMGFDVHRLEEGEALWLGGILVPHSQGLSGHSDADVAIHALVDAILGALAEGDIGSHFPPSDPQWRGASSDRFLAFAAERVAARGGLIDHVDLTIICEAPKIGPHRDAMRARLAEIMGIPLGQVSVKATTTERLGLTGRGEGIAAQAVATIRLPGNPQAQES